MNRVGRRGIGCGQQGASLAARCAGCWHCSTVQRHCRWQRPRTRRLIQGDQFRESVSACKVTSSSISISGDVGGGGLSSDSRQSERAGSRFESDAIEVCLPLEGESRTRWCMVLANQKDRKLAEQRHKAHAADKSERDTESRPMTTLARNAWRPRWRVMRGCDSFPGSDVGRPMHVGQIGSAKLLCEEGGFSGLVLWGSHVYLRPRMATDVLKNAAQKQIASDLLLPPPVPREQLHSMSTDETVMPLQLRVAVLATQDEFDETTILDMGMVSTTGNGRRYAAQALLHNLVASDSIDLVAVLLFDWKNSSDENCASSWAVPVEGPELLSLCLRGSRPVAAWRGSEAQLLGAAAGELHVDVAISIQARRPVVELMHKCITARTYAVMGHDYNLPYGPWGMEVDEESLMEHRKSLEHTSCTMLCTSQHLCDYITRFSNERIRTRLCYCADYGYFDLSVGQHTTFPPQICEGPCVTMISPCPSKGLPILLRLALMLPSVCFLCVSTVWTKSLHEVQLRAHPNIEVVPGMDDVGSIYERTGVLLVPSLWAEAFGLVALEAQLRGIPVVSTDACGLAEANLLPELRVPDVPLVHDARTRRLLRGINIEEAEGKLNPLRRKEDDVDTCAYRQAVELAHTYIATEAEALGFAIRLQELLQDPLRRREAGLLARERAVAHVSERRGLFVQALHNLVS